MKLQIGTTLVYFTWLAPPALYMSHSLHLSHSCEAELVSASYVQPPADTHAMSQ